MPVSGHQGASGNVSPPGSFHPHPRIILSVSLSSDTFAGGAPDGTVVGAISVGLSSGIFNGSLTLSGADAADFQIVGANLETSGVVAAGSYDINIVATQTGVSNSPFTQPETITGTSAVAVLKTSSGNDVLTSSANTITVGA